MSSVVAREELMTVVTPVKGETMALELTGETEDGRLLMRPPPPPPPASVEEEEDVEDAGETDEDCLRLMLLDTVWISSGPARDMMTGESRPPAAAFRLRLAAKNELLFIEISTSSEISIVKFLHYEHPESLVSNELPTFC